MNRNIGKIEQNLFVSLIMLIAILTQVLFLTNDDNYFTIFIPIGISVGFYIAYGKKVFPGIVISTFFGVLLFSFFFSDKTFIESFLYTLPILFINILSAYFMSLFLRIFKCKIPNTVTKGSYYLLSMILTVLILGLFPAFQFTVLHNSTYIYELGKICQPLFVGLSIFSTTIILSNQYDFTLTPRTIPNKKDIIFTIIFTGFSFLIFSNYFTSFNFASYSFLFIILFMINAYIYNYRMLLFVSYIYIVIYNITNVDMLDSSENFRVASLFNLYLVILVVITIFTKILIQEIKRRNMDLEEAKEKLSGMLDSTINLLSVGNTLDFKDISYQETYIVSIFDIAMKIFPEISHGVCGYIDNKAVQTLSTKGYDLEFFKKLNFPVEQLQTEVYTPILNTDTQTIFKEAFGDQYDKLENKLPKIKQTLIIIIKLSKKSKGIILFDIPAGSKKVFTENDINNIAAFQKMINSFYETNELSLKNVNLKDDIVLSLIRTLELYDPYTGGHSEDVATLSKFIAEKMNLSAEEIYDVYWAGIVHDIGKIGISSDIINKPSRLTLAEYKEVQKHPIYGFDVLNRSDELKTIAKIVKHHHEWYNGSGYPDKLKNEEIPFGAQILQVADSVSSMATSRIYQKSKTFDEIIKELQLYKGTQFNPIICEHMIELIKSGVIEHYFKNNKYHSN